MLAKRKVYLTIKQKSDFSSLNIFAQYLRFRLYPQMRLSFYTSTVKTMFSWTFNYEGCVYLND